VAGRRFDAGDIVALILASALGLVLLLTAIMVLVFDHDLSGAGGRLLTTIGVGLVGSLSVYLGRTIAKNGKKHDDEEQE